MSSRSKPPLSPGISTHSICHWVIALQSNWDTGSIQNLWCMDILIPGLCLYCIVIQVSPCLSAKADKVHLPCIPTCLIKKQIMSTGTAHSIMVHYSPAKVAIVMLVFARLIISGTCQALNAWWKAAISKSNSSEWCTMASMSWGK